MTTQSGRAFKPTMDKLLYVSDTHERDTAPAATAPDVASNVVLMCVVIDRECDGARS